jgi:hypothetical protein
MEIWEPKPPGTLWATPGLLQDSFTFTFIDVVISTVQSVKHDIRKVPADVFFLHNPNTGK